jgi:hypothetical protein
MQLMPARINACRFQIRAQRHMGGSAFLRARRVERKIGGMGDHRPGNGNMESGQGKTLLRQGSAAPHIPPVNHKVVTRLFSAIHKPIRGMGILFTEAPTISPEIQSGFFDKPDAQRRRILTPFQAAEFQFLSRIVCFCHESSLFGINDIIATR